MSSPKDSKFVAEANWRPLAWHCKASDPKGSAHAHVIVFASTQIIGHDIEIMSDLVFAVGKLAGTEHISSMSMTRTPQQLASLQHFIISNWNI